MSKTERDSFVFYRSFFEALRNVPKKYRSEVYDAVFAYAFESCEPSLSGVPRALWELIRPQLDASQKRYENAKKGAEYGKLGGRPKKKEEKTKPLKGYENETLNVNVNVNENVNDNENVNVNALGVSKQPTSAADTQHTECNSDTQTNRPSNIEIARTILEEGYRMDGASIKAFMEYNEERGWKMDWKQALKRWAEREKPPDYKPKKNKFNNFERNTDNIELERKVIQMQLGGST